MDKEVWQEWIEEVSDFLGEGQGDGIPIKLRAVLPQLIATKVEELGYRKLPKDKPPLLSDEEIGEIFLKEDWSCLEECDVRVIAQAQREADIRYYETHKD